MGAAGSTTLTAEHIRRTVEALIRSGGNIIQKCRANPYVNFRTQMEIRAAAHAAEMTPDIAFLLCMGSGPLRADVRSKAVMLPALKVFSQPTPSNPAQEQKIPVQHRFNYGVFNRGQVERFQTVFRSLPKPHPSAAARFVYGEVLLDFQGNRELMHATRSQVHTNAFIYDRNRDELLYIEKHELSTCAKATPARTKAFNTLRTVLHGAGAPVRNA